MMTANRPPSNLLLILIVIFLSISVNTFSQSENGINFIKPKNWEEVLSIAKAQHKSIFVDAYTTWCGPCKMMENNVYPNSALGVLINKDFISVKIQMDSTQNDDAYVRSWYNDARKTMQSAKIEAFPTLLFYTPNGNMLLNIIGYKDVTAMTAIANFAGNTDVAAQLNKYLDAYKNGIKDYSKMIALSRFVKLVLQDNKLALQIAKDYKSGYLDEINMEHFYTKENIMFIREFNMQLVSINDKFFKICYNEPEKIDTILGKGTADQYVPAIIARDEVQNRLYKDGELIVKNPKWRVIRDIVKFCYPKINVEELMLSEKIAFYQRTKQWDTYTFYMSYRIRKNPPKPEDAFFALNDPAWNVFKNTSDKVALQRALEWSNLSIKLQGNVQFYDTKANLLYRLGRKGEAIKFQRLTIEKNKELIKKEGRNWFPEYTVNLDKMLNGKPTWSTK